MLDFVKWYFVTIFIYFVVYYFYFMLKVPRRDEIFPSLLELVNHIRDQKHGPGGFTDIFACITIVYVIVYALGSLVSVYAGVF